MEDINDIILETIEVFFNHVLYIRDIYPVQIFKKRRIYNTPVYASIYPPLNTYLYKVLRTTRELLISNDLDCVEMLFYKDSTKAYERYKFEVKPLVEQIVRKDEFLIEYEEHLRNALYTLAERTKGLEKLPSDCRFKILVHTKHTSFLKLSHNPNYQDFPWLRCDLLPEKCSRNISLLPITSINSMGLTLTAEIL